jgi:hypothetical protein
VQPDECYAKPADINEATRTGAQPWDYFHINSVDRDSKGNYVISARHCKAVYYIDGSTGEILWKLGGKNSTFTMGENTHFAFQHDARFRNDDGLLLS